MTFPMWRDTVWLSAASHFLRLHPARTLSVCVCVCLCELCLSEVCVCILCMQVIYLSQGSLGWPPRLNPNSLARSLSRQRAAVHSE